MADNKFLQEDCIAGGSFSQLLFSDEEVGLDSSGFFNYTTTFSYENSPKMLCFGDNHCNGFNLDAHKPGSITCSDSLLRSNKKRNGSAAIAKDVQSLITGTGAPAENQKYGKKNKAENSMVTEHPKVVKKENLGERISALQQIVSPYGKTDTASVLHEAMGYIRFLHDQVQVLCSPYLQRLPSSSVLPYEGGENGGEEKSKNLMSRGLCLVPVEFTLHVANDNGADFWSPLTVDPTSEH